MEVSGNRRLVLLSLAAIVLLARCNMNAVDKPRFMQSGSASRSSAIHLHPRSHRQRKLNIVARHQCIELFVPTDSGELSWLVGELTRRVTVCPNALLQLTEHTWMTTGNNYYEKKQHLAWKPLLGVVNRLGNGNALLSSIGSPSARHANDVINPLTKAVTALYNILQLPECTERCALYLADIVWPYLPWMSMVVDQWSSHDWTNSDRKQKMVRFPQHQDAHFVVSQMWKTDGTVERPEELHSVAAQIAQLQLRQKLKVESLPTAASPLNITEPPLQYTVTHPTPERVSQHNPWNQVLKMPGSEICWPLITVPSADFPAFDPLAAALPRDFFVPNRPSTLRSLHTLPVPPQPPAVWYGVIAYLMEGEDVSTEYGTPERWVEDVAELQDVRRTLDRGVEYARGRLVGRLTLVVFTANERLGQCLEHMWSCLRDGGGGMTSDAKSSERRDQGVCGCGTGTYDALWPSVGAATKCDVIVLEVVVHDPLWRLGMLHRAREDLLISDRWQAEHDVFFMYEADTDISAATMAHILHTYGSGELPENSMLGLFRYECASTRQGKTGFPPGHRCSAWSAHALVVDTKPQTNHMLVVRARSANDNRMRYWLGTEGVHEAGFVLSKHLLQRAIASGCLESRRHLPQLDLTQHNDHWALGVRPLAMGEFAVRCFAKLTPLARYPAFGVHHASNRYVNQRNAWGISPTEMAEAGIGMCVDERSA